MLSMFASWYSWAPRYALQVVDALRTTWVVDLGTKIDAQASAGRIELYTAPKPSKGAAVGAAVKATTINFQKPIFGASPGPVSGVGTVQGTPLSDTNAAGGGGAPVTWARISDGGGNFVADMTVTATGGGGDVTIDNTTITAGGTVNLTSGTFTAGNA